MTPDIIYEDADVLALNKPAGLMVHADGRSTEPTLVNWIEEHRPELIGIGEPQALQSGEVIDRSGIVHRLDRKTSGVIVLAKTKESFAALKQQFQGRSVKKTYNAFIYGIPKERAGTITLPIGKSAGDFRLWSAERGARGELREAITEYRVLSAGEEASFVEVQPKTGRTHQIRVHFKALQHPVVCDKRYAPKRPCILGFTRLALHARSIGLTTPSGATVLLEAELPEDFREALALLKSEHKTQKPESK